MNEHYRWTAYWINNAEDLDDLIYNLELFVNTRFTIKEIKFKTANLKVKFHKRFPYTSEVEWNSPYGLIKLSSYKEDWS